MEYTFTTVVAVTFGLLLVNIIQPGTSFSVEKRMELKEQYASNAASKIASAKDVKKDGPLQFIVDMVPSNFVQATGNNKNMLQVIFLQFYLALLW